MDELGEFREKTGGVMPAVRPLHMPPWEIPGRVPSSMSPFCDPFSRRPCLTLCAPPPGRGCAWEEDRRELVRVLSECAAAVTIGKLKAGCSGECARGPLIGFPHKEFFYVGVVSKDSAAVKNDTLQDGRILFHLLSVSSRRSYRADIYYDHATGLLAAIDDHVCMVEVAKYFLDFEDGVSCGKCVPCRIGVRRARESINRVISGRGKKGDLDQIRTLCAIMELTPNCDYASSAMRPVKSAITHFEEEFTEHIERKCRAGVCGFDA
ncbi:MAG: NADH-ubiquinone oxidoreductase-F iron-sulfur binding region domain-containing protein [Syntrophobacteraceae bacterium]